MLKCCRKESSAPASQLVAKEICIAGPIALQMGEQDNVNTWQQLRASIGKPNRIVEYHPFINSEVKRKKDMKASLNGKGDQCTSFN